jgi:hypothetical protein
MKCHRFPEQSAVTPVLVDVPTPPVRSEYSMSAVLRWAETELLGSARDCGRGPKLPSENVTQSVVLGELAGSIDEAAIPSPLARHRCSLLRLTDGSRDALPRGPPRRSRRLLLSVW